MPTIAELHLKAEVLSLARGRRLGPWRVMDAHPGTVHRASCLDCVGEVSTGVLRPGGPAPGVDG